MAKYQLTINGQRKEVTVDPSTPLLWVLREDLKMTGTKYGCGVSACGACTVHVDGVAARSCVLPVSHVGERAVVTIEAMSEDAVGRVGQIMCAVALLKHTKKPTDTNIEEYMSGNICRCATYVRIREAVKVAAQKL